MNFPTSNFTDTPPSKCEACYIEEKNISLFRTKIFNIFKKMAKDALEAEELTQEYFYKTIKKDGMVDLNMPLRYVYTIAKCVFYDRLRRHRVREKEKHDSFDEINKAPIKNELSPEVIAENEQQYLDFLRAFNQLTRKEKEVFVLNRYEGVTYPKIAEMLCLSVSSVEKRMMRALTKLRKSSFFKMHIQGR